jgi:hypothetical protein
MVRCGQFPQNAEAVCHLAVFGDFDRRIAIAAHVRGIRRLSPLFQGLKGGRFFSCGAHPNALLLPVAMHGRTSL